MKFAGRLDIIIVAVLAAAAILAWTLYTGVLGKAGTTAEIYYRSQLVKTVALKTGQDETFSIQQEPDVVFRLHPDGSISFEESDCPDKICIESGKLHLAGQYAACLPNLIYVKIVSEEDADGAADIYI